MSTAWDTVKLLETANSLYNHIKWIQLDYITDGRGQNLSLRYDEPETHKEARACCLHGMLYLAANRSTQITSEERRGHAISNARGILVATLEGMNIRPAIRRESLVAFNDSRDPKTGKTEITALLKAGLDRARIEYEDERNAT